MESAVTRLNKFLSEAGYCSRRAADKLIEEGRVTVNGKHPEMGTKVSSTDEVSVDGKVVSIKKKSRVYIAFNKPVGVVCTTDTRVEKNNIIDFINYPSRIFPIGRLDKDSEGLILLTDDGDIVNKILRSSNNHEKEYIVRVDKPISQTFVKRMSEGVPILDTMTKPCRVQKLSRDSFKIVLTQGLNRQIRRMCSYLDYEVESLKRVRIMNINLMSDVGEYRNLTKEELNTLNKALKSSKKTW
ncbi:ribosomal large subunit pseudouridine synthase F [Formosa sp. Hel3_A1_48]|jgi:23S rRNA pseudouridine2604 synthase|uniref:23S rRNA pseudouridine(2604) synthase RluF n=1 Tax=Formosa sp. Hel3_A1_48 TaxID=1336795 RepID=UPI00084E1BE4|nr:23S rRNA pseudouridine(2604) synthase RluF [Formosa sp. Hel3_A1_48]MDC0635288.1 23S rRNA pseudouridine(2604) synthase RluF [Flavobacteriaceae bacterium]AOR25729.1 ribosomal large subunit pseudouridine synthase F [Formosa sp. Hel3_A1_48]MDG1056118.1 23S rRNA pseudouridine(2604) synthase RluF [Flavobacteriaceae bacterium]MDG1673092.1 23S rRNA pseudouridine(2604) synthase RluF [Flavobacteriaceae bacterium]MDG2483434.1 23S rRNA pseudouridine(2604) synthase RluF [Flavobacteriaceae bacterium]|tara:strand:- start:1308 stop:2033 length:726 start_codon:yes stop_codon:yes gene_type:complete